MRGRYVNLQLSHLREAAARLRRSRHLPDDDLPQLREGSAVTEINSDFLTIVVMADAPGEEPDIPDPDNWRRADVVLNGVVVATGWARKAVGAGRDSTEADTWRAVEGEAITRAKSMLCERIPVMKL